METRAIFARMASWYDTEERVQMAGVIAEAIRRELRDCSGGSALDYGCGTGLIGLALADAFDSMLLVDSVPEMVLQVQRKIDAAGIRSAAVQRMDFAERVPEGLQVDCAMMSQVLLHVKDVQGMLQSLCAAIRPGGRLIVVDFDFTERVISDKVHPGFEQAALVRACRDAGFSAAMSYTFCHGKACLMNEDASLFLLHARK